MTQELGRDLDGWRDDTFKKDLFHQTDASYLRVLKKKSDFHKDYEANKIVKQYASIFL